MEYIILYMLVGLVSSFVFDILNETVIRPDDKIQFDWWTRTINILIWPYILCVFISSIIRYYIDN
jgi:hypothetical protein